MKRSEGNKLKDNYININKLKALLQPRRFDSLRICEDGKTCVCVCCGIVGEQLLKLKHKRNCGFVKYMKAMKYLTDICLGL